MDIEQLRQTFIGTFEDGKIDHQADATLHGVSVEQPAGAGMEDRLVLEVDLEVPAGDGSPFMPVEIFHICGAREAIRAVTPRLVGKVLSGDERVAEIYEISPTTTYLAFRCGQVLVACPSDPSDDQPALVEIDGQLYTCETL